MATKSDILSDYYKMPKTKAGVLADYEKLTRRANDRLYQIEKRSTTDGLKALTQYAYKRAVHDLKGATRFPTKERIENLNYNEVVKRLNDMRRFLKSGTSTARGLKSMYAQNTVAFNQKYKTSFTTSELAKFFNKDTGLYEKIKVSHPEWGSETVMKAIAQIRLSKEKVLDKIKEENKKHLDIDAPVMVQDVMDTIISEFDTDVQEMLTQR